MSNTPFLRLEELTQNPNNPDITVNSDLRILDAAVQLIVNDRTTSAPPGSPSDGDRYIVAVGATGDWAGQDNNIAWWDGAQWQFLIPFDGWTAFDRGARQVVRWNTTVWLIDSTEAGSISPGYAQISMITNLVTQALTANTPVQLEAFDTIDVQRNVTASLVPGANSSGGRFTVVAGVTGRFLFNVSLAFQSSANALVAGMIYVNGAQTGIAALADTSNNNIDFGSISFAPMSVSLAAGDYVDLYVESNAAATLTYYSSFFNITHIDNG